MRANCCYVAYVNAPGSCRAAAGLVFIQPTIVGSETDTYRASLKEEKRSMVGTEMSQLAHRSDYAQPTPVSKKSKYQK